ncbi:MAG: hypothetical protein A3D56_01055 [Candidatus Taylorbacteria bacterium RIFCSPHIGHO2_02_FULL_45_35]|uniref:Uncharacterized protein n=1 Tax=Candidatus Taylorbacteria bacterium RIFCSPHIGHO2_02_FULL_45_35 TaxID=1802311 RepID=A0A1G2MPN0_9BACT|nr:MAG: hypothetical protein A3D56_01055 [Candidatus Taylorbacteria bacterium RIFCSPHIGHO2_02_FULL_45_35]
MKKFWRVIFFAKIKVTNEKSKVTALGNLSATQEVRVRAVMASRRVPLGFRKKSETVGVKY